MLAKILPAPLIGFIAYSLHTVQTIFWFIPIFLVALVKFFIRLKPVTRLCNKLLNFCATSWISVNFWITDLTKTVVWDIQLPQGLSTKQWYLLVGNHQSWVDILALQKAFNRKIPFIKFFLKQELIWVPFLGLAWWAMDLPFMKRYSKSYLKKHPEKKGKDFETTKKACEKFKTMPISIMNFAEGTRFTHQKHDIQQSPYENLLKPKSGGIGYVISLMGEQIHQVLNITINYPDNDEFTFWDFMCGKVKRVQLHAELIPVPELIQGNYIDSPEVRKQTQKWLNQLWVDKDRQLSRLAAPTKNN